MKYFNIIPAALLIAAILTACGTDNNAASKQPPASPSTTAAATTLPSDSASVKTAREESFGENSETVFRFPALNFDSSDAKAINREISELYTPIFDAAKAAAKAGKALAYSSIDYNAYVNDDIISIVIADETTDHVFSYHVYNFNKTTGKRVDNAALIEYLQLDSDQTYADLKQSLQNDYTSKFKYENFKKDYYYQLEMTVGDDAIKESQLFLNGNGELYAICIERASIGKGEFCVMIAV